jgi:tetratricopeptide (TPR) repeat protein
MSGEPADAAARRAEVALELKKYSLAERLAQECIAAAPGHAIGYWLLARTFRARKRAPEALRAAREARRLDPDEPAYSQLIGLLLLDCRELEAARAEAAALVSWRPDWPPAWELKARAELMSGILDAAEESARRLVALAPGDPNAFHLLGQVLWQRGRYEEAHACFTTGLGLAPEHPDCLAGLVSWLLRQRRFDEARAVARELVRVAPEDPQTAELYMRTVGYARPFFRPWASCAFLLTALRPWQRLAISLPLIVPQIGIPLVVFVLAILFLAGAWHGVRRETSVWRCVARGAASIGLALAAVLLSPILYPVALLYLWSASLLFRYALRRGWFL